METLYINLYRRGKCQSKINTSYWTFGMVQWWWGTLGSCAMTTMGTLFPETCKWLLYHTPALRTSLRGAANNTALIDEQGNTVLHQLEIRKILPTFWLDALVVLRAEHRQTFSDFNCFLVHLCRFQLLFDSTDNYNGNMSQDCHLTSGATPPVSPQAPCPRRSPHDAHY